MQIVVYFDHLVGAAPTQKLVEMLKIVLTIFRVHEAAESWIRLQDCLSNHLSSFC